MEQKTQFCMLLKPVFPGRKRGGLKFTDEPTGNLDEDTSAGIIELLKRTAHESGKCVIVVTHSRQLAEEADEVLEIKEGKLQVM